MAPLLFHKHVHDIRLLWEMNQLCWQIEYLKNTLLFRTVKFQHAMPFREKCGHINLLLFIDPTMVFMENHLHHIPKLVFKIHENSSNRAHFFAK